MELLFPILENVGIASKQLEDTKAPATKTVDQYYYDEDDGKKEIFNGACYYL